MFEGCSHRKYQIEYTNIPELGKEIDRICPSDKYCGRTGQPHASWKHSVNAGKVTRFATHDLAQYPIGFCEAKAKAYVSYLKRVGCKSRYSFIEIFCGLNAPLTEAVTHELKRHNAAVAMVLPALSMEVPIGTASQASAALLASPRAAGTSSRKEPSRYQWASLATGMQPRWNPAYQLIPDGLNDELEHFRRAKHLLHPGLDEGELVPDLLNSIEAVRSRGLELIHHRIQVVNTLEERAGLSWKLNASKLMGVLGGPSNP
jgi:hypothetical protein